MADTRIFLIRHGQANAATESFVAGHKSCSGLSAHGKEQAAALRDRLAATGELGTVDAFYASLMERAFETARIIAPAVGELEIVRDCGVCEIHPGDEVDGLTWDEFRARYSPPEVWDPYVRWAPGCETWAEFAARAGSRLTELAREHEGQTVVIACHGGVIEASFVAFGRMPLERPFSMQAENTSITEWRRPEAPVTSGSAAGGDAAVDRGRWHLMRFNDAAHLTSL